MKLAQFEMDGFSGIYTNEERKNPFIELPINGVALENYESTKQKKNGKLLGTLKS